MKKEKNLYDIINHLGEDQFNYSPVTTPIYQTSNFFFPDFKSLHKALQDEKLVPIYTRGQNPTVRVVEKKIAALENGEEAKLFSSGIAAIAAAVMAFLKSGDEVVCVRDCYCWTYRLFDQYLQRFGIKVNFVEGTRIEHWESQVNSKTKLFMLESPTTFSFDIQNLQQVADLAKRNNIKTVIDNSWATPCYQNPLDYGIDLVVHSCSKYLGGHSDLVGGVVVGSAEDISVIFSQEFMNKGSCPSPFDSWLLLRGLRTLPLRMERHYSSTMKLVRWLKNCSRVKQVLYPLDQDHPQYDLAVQQLRGGSGLFSFRLDTKLIEDVVKFTDNLKVFRKAVSWGGFESLVVPAAATSTKDADKIDIIRLHVGLDDPEVLMEDLDQAFGKMNHR
ncbi:MAG: cystathionine beta-lyase [Desulfuromonas sp. SDB]|nr:MAG: cystathionine beta-lyase [Desulfuromonas sp. SDB]